MQITKRDLLTFVLGLFLILNFQYAFAETAVPTQEGEVLADQQSTERGSVINAGFTTSVDDNEPTEDLSEIMNSASRVYFFSDLDGMDGQTVTHRWKYGSSIIANSKITVTGSRFRAWSSYEMQPEWTGTWFIEIVDGNDKVIGTKSFVFMAPL